MAKLKIKNRYGIVPNELSNNPKISFKAKGLFAYMQSKPDNWSFSVYRISKQTKEGEDAIKSAIKELEKYGYLEKKATKDKEGKWSGYDYLLNDYPLVENPPADNSLADNTPTLSKKDISKKEVVKKKHSFNKLKEEETSLDKKNKPPKKTDKRNPDIETVLDLFEKEFGIRPPKIKASNGFDLNRGSISRMLKKFSLGEYSKMLLMVFKFQKKEKFIKKCTSPLEFENNFASYKLFFEKLKETIISNQIRQA